MQEFDDDFLTLLDELNRQVAICGEPVAGNYLYDHNDPAFPRAAINQRMRKKRDNLRHAAQGKNLALEIGMNAGHSALIALYHSPGMILHAVDVCLHSYTKIAAEFLAVRFPGRFYFHPKGSLHALPWLAARHSEWKFDLIHIDGNHDAPFVETDFFNALRVAEKHAWVLLDDTGNRYPYVQECVRAFIAAGLAEEIPSPYPDMHDAGNKLLQLR